MAQDFIRVRGARQHNLRGVDVDIPRHRLVVFTGVSGSGKTSLAFDTIFAEGQRRFMQSLRLAARAQMEMLPRPEVESLEGLSPCIAIHPRQRAGSARSTIATATEIHDYLRTLYAALGRPHDPQTGEALSRTSAQEMADALLGSAAEKACCVLAPLGAVEAGTWTGQIEKLRRQGFMRLRFSKAGSASGPQAAAPSAVEAAKGHAEGLVELEELGPQPPAEGLAAELVTDRLVLRAASRGRLMEAIEAALKWNAREVRVLVAGEELPRSFTTCYANPRTGYLFPQLSAQHFSFNTPQGACPRCQGMGTEPAPSEDLIIAEPQLSLREGTVRSWWSRQPKLKAAQTRSIEALAAHFKVDADLPAAQWPKAFRQCLLHGSEGRALPTGWSEGPQRRAQARVWEGLLVEARRLHEQARSETLRRQLARFFVPLPCPLCEGRRLRAEALAVKLPFATGMLGIQEFCALPIETALQALQRLQLRPEEQPYGEALLAELGKRLEFLQHIGLGYLSLDRDSSSLSGGEFQRVRLATQLGSALSGVLYVLDEPSIGLHPADTQRLIRTLEHLRDLGNSVLVVEHDESIIRAADHVLELGPGAGDQGGHLIAQGSLEDLLRAPQSITAPYLNGSRRVALPQGASRRGNARLPGLGLPMLRILGARHHNLKNLSVEFPVGAMTCVTGPSGSGKTTLVHHLLMRALARHFHAAKAQPGEMDGLEGLEHFKKAVLMDQSPIGRSARSNPATFCGAFDAIREVFAQLPAARARGFDAGRFSFNTPGGRCEKCEGEGQLEVDMQLLPELQVTCPLCEGRRYNRETLEIAFKGRNIAEVLELSVEQALEFFGAHSPVSAKLAGLRQCGLGYLRLGQPASQLSGGEAQRLKLATELSRRTQGRCLYVLDEPTTGLHFADVQRLLEVLAPLREAGNTIILVEHHLEVIRCADWVVDLGPGGGEHGGSLIFAGTPQDLAKHPDSPTGRFLRQA